MLQHTHDRYSIRGHKPNDLKNTNIYLPTEYFISQCPIFYYNLLLYVHLHQIVYQNMNSFIVHYVPVKIMVIFYNSNVLYESDPDFNVYQIAP